MKLPPPKEGTGVPAGGDRRVEAVRLRKPFGQRERLAFKGLLEKLRERGIWRLANESTAFVS